MTVLRYIMKHSARVASLQMRRIKKQMQGNISARLCSAFSAFQCKQLGVSSSIRLFAEGSSGQTTY